MEIIEQGRYGVASRHRLRIRVDLAAGDMLVDTAVIAALVDMQELRQFFFSKLAWIRFRHKLTV
jgi:hypothetical protein